MAAVASRAGDSPVSTRPTVTTGAADEREVPYFAIGRGSPVDCRNTANASLSALERASLRRRFIA